MRNLRNLRNLDVSWHGHPVTQADADALLRSPLAANLRQLRLGRVTQEARRALLRAKSLSGLTAFDVSGDPSPPSPPDGLVGRWVREATHLQHLTWLDVSHSRLGNDGIAALADSPHLARLTYLDVSGNGVTGAGLKPLAQSPHLPALRTLVVGFPYGDQKTYQLLQERFDEVKWY